MGKTIEPGTSHGRLNQLGAASSAGGGPSILLALLLQDVLLLALAVFLLRRRRLPLSLVGLRRPTPRQIAMGLLLGLGLFVVAYGAGKGLELVLQRILPRTIYARATGSTWAEREFGQLMSPWQRLIFALIGSCAAPLSEEIFFRGYLYTSLRGRWGVSAGIIGSALIFALLHFGPFVAICMIFLIGIAMAAVYERTGSLWMPILMHSVNNALSFAILWTGWH